MAKLYSWVAYNKIRIRLKLSTLFTMTETEEPTKYLVRYNQPQKLFVWSHHAFQVVADPVGEILDCECKLWPHRWGLKKMLHIVVLIFAKFLFEWNDRKHAPLPKKQVFSACMSCAWCRQLRLMAFQRNTSSRDTPNARTSSQHSTKMTWGQ